MKVSRTVRQAAAILVVVFLLTTIWAVYYVYEATRESTPPSPTAVASFTQAASNGFVVSLAPSYLYNNATEIVGGNFTLFTSITKWINVTMLYSLSSNRSVSMALHESFTVVLSTPVWSRTLFQSNNSTAGASTQLLPLVTHYDVNVSQVTTLATEIDVQIGYTPAVYALTLSPVTSGSVSVDGASQAISADPLLNFSISGGLITPTGFSYSSDGSVELPSTPTSPGVFSEAVPYSVLAASVVGLVLTAVVATRPREERTPPLDELIAPYAEAIAETAAAPDADVTIPVGQFADLVKIADTLGKPVLRPAGSDPGRTEFLVLDGWIAYSYRYPGSPAAGAASPSRSPPAPSPPARASVRSTGRVVERIQYEANRMRGLSLDEETKQEVLRRVRRAIELVHRKELFEAEVEVDELASLLDRAEMRSTRGSPSGAVDH